MLTSNSGFFDVYSNLFVSAASYNQGAPIDTQRNDGQILNRQKFTALPAS